MHLLSHFELKYRIEFSLCGRGKAGARRWRSPSAVDLSLSGLLQARLLTLDAARVVLEQAEELEWPPGAHVVRLQRPRDRRDAGLALSSQAATVDSNVNVEHARVRSHREWIENFVPLRRVVEVLDEWLAIDCDSSCSCSDVDDGAAGFALAEAPRPALAVQLGLSALLGQGSPEVKQVDAVELGEVVRAFQIVRPASQPRGVDLIGEPAQVRAQVVLVVRVLANGVEQGDLLVLLGREGADRVVAQGVLELDFFEDFFGSVDRASRNLVNLRLVVEPAWLLRVEGCNDAGLPIKLILALIFRG